ncbi:MAG: glycogen/starch/alpha-glucan phosphorylase [Eubacteriales bacterium]|nr:glycogen/starch/alpha-glucan phosphorylase [Eubacteriales bacterium]
MNSKTSKFFKEAIAAHLASTAGKSTKTATTWEYWNALALSINQTLALDWERTRERYREGRQQHYFSAEFLVGRSMLNNLVNLGVYEEAKAALEEYGQNIDDILEEEHDAALGNGGLGRLAACFLDSSATLDYPVTGYGILYRYGLFRQEFQDGFQREFPDSWMEEGYPFVVPKRDDRVRIHYNDLDVYAVPYDMPITGYGTKNVNTLRLWRPEPYEEFDFNLFNSQRFDDSVRERNRVEDICRVLYPNDSTYDGKVLRVRQQYFFVSASLQNIFKEYCNRHGNDMSHFSEEHCIQMNDTHPVIAIPELMRILMSEHACTFEQAFDIAKSCFAYTNHTILTEAMEQWDIGIFQFLMPEILKLIYRIDDRFRSDMAQRGLHGDLINYLAPIGNGKVRMAWIACYMAYSINGVAALHTEILKSDTLKDWYKIFPEKFNNKTNGVTPRRWLRVCNPELSKFLTERLGSEEWITDMQKLSQLAPLADDPSVLKEIMAIKKEKKRQCAAYIADRLGIEVSENAIFDVQIKRLHEYKRQLLNAFYILDLYFRIKDNPRLDVPPRVCIFAAKAAPGYARAKAIIKFINEIARVINQDPVTAGRLKVVFLPNYNVSQAMHLFPAADISEQISTAGKEASGTGNMKFMMNGALTLGTMDGANVEIVDAVGEENAYIFGVRSEDMAATRAYYNPQWQYENIPGLKRVLDTLVNNFFDDGGTSMFKDLYDSLLRGSSWEPADVYYVLGDFDHYRKVRDQMAEDYLDQNAWARKSFINIINSGRFSSDRTIEDYAGDVWHIEAEKI